MWPGEVWVAEVYMQGHAWAAVRTASVGRSIYLEIESAVPGRTLALQSARRQERQMKSRFLQLCRWAALRWFGCAGARGAGEAR